MDIGMPPAQPPQAPNGLAGVTSMIRPQPGQQPGAPAAGGPAGNPTGDLAVKGEAVRRVVTDMAKNEQFAPYAKRMIDILDTGLQAAAGSSDQGGQPGAGAPNGGDANGGGFPG